jgi:hypothetical protein
MGDSFESILSLAEREFHHAFAAGIRVRSGYIRIRYGRSQLADTAAAGTLRYSQTSRAGPIAPSIPKRDTCRFGETAQVRIDDTLVGPKYDQFAGLIGGDQQGTKKGTHLFL